MSRCVIFGGASHLGSMLARRFASSGRFDEIVVADLKPLHGLQPESIRFVPCDIRGRIAPHVVATGADWIFNFAEVHREAGHRPEEFFDTNMAGAQSVCDYADTIGCRNIFFGSSVAVYGSSNGPLAEDAPKRPDSRYGFTKLAAELMHEVWVRSGPARRLVIMRPAPIHGPGGWDDVNRLIRSVKRGYVLLSGSSKIRRSYGYIFGAMESIEFVMERHDPSLTYNYAEAVTETIGDQVRIIRSLLSSRAAAIPLPTWMFGPMSHTVQAITRGKRGRTRGKVHENATEQWIEPQRLKELGFEFRYDFTRSLAHWRQQAPEEF